MVGAAGQVSNKMSPGENYQKVLKWRGGGHSFIIIKLTWGFFFPKCAIGPPLFRNNYAWKSNHLLTHSLCFCYFSGQICFCLINFEPIPYAVELKKVPKREMLAAITEMITKGVIPKQNQIYREKHETAWFHLLQAGKASIKIDPSERPSAKAFQDILCNTLESCAYPLRNHQGSALEQAQNIFSGKIFYKRVLYNEILNQLNYHPVFCFKNLNILIFKIFFHIF